MYLVLSGVVNIVFRIYSVAHVAHWGIYVRFFAQLVLFQSLLGPRHTTRIFFRFIFMPPHSVYCLEALQAHVGIVDYIFYGTYGHCVLKIQILNQLLFTIFAGCFHRSFFVDKRFLFFLFSIILTIVIFFYSS